MLVISTTVYDEITKLETRCWVLSREFRKGKEKKENKRETQKGKRGPKKEKSEKGKDKTKGKRKKRKIKRKNKKTKIRPLKLLDSPATHWVGVVCAHWACGILERGWGPWEAQQP